ncbi:hypothetical protein BST61_g2753 [Cercospora zeina]
MQGGINLNIEESGKSPAEKLPEQAVSESASPNQLSIALALESYLRQALQCGVPMSEDGYVSIENMLLHPIFITSENITMTAIVQYAQSYFGTQWMEIAYENSALGYRLAAGWYVRSKPGVEPMFKRLRGMRSLHESKPLFGQARPEIQCNDCISFRAASDPPCDEMVPCNNCLSMFRACSYAATELSSLLLSTVDDLPKRMNEARNSAEILKQMVENTSSNNLKEDELGQEFLKRCQNSRKDVHAFVKAADANVDSARYADLMMAERLCSEAIFLYYGKTGYGLI